MTQTELKQDIAELKSAIAVTKDAERKNKFQVQLEKLESKLDKEKKPKPKKKIEVKAKIKKKPVPKKKVIVKKLPTKKTNLQKKIDLIRNDKFPEDHPLMILDKDSSQFAEALDEYLDKKAKKPVVKKKVIVKPKPKAKFKVDDWVKAIAFGSGLKGQVYEMREAVTNKFAYRLKDEWNNKDEKWYPEHLLMETTKPISKKKVIPKPIPKKAITIIKGKKIETHKTAFDKDIKDAILVLNKERYVIREKVDRKTRKVEKVKHSAEYRNARTIEKKVDSIFNSSIYDIAKTRKEKIEKKPLIDEINQVKELTTLWLNEVDMIINQEAKSDLVAIKKLLIGLIKEAQKNDPSDKYKLAGGLDKIAKKYNL